VQSFLAVLDAGSLSGAAKKLGAQQPTLSRQIASLEAQLGAPLFERTGRGVAPTALALAIADDAHAMQRGAEQLQQRLGVQGHIFLLDLCVVANQAALLDQGTHVGGRDGGQRCGRSG
jgi:DNA-binding transcriptional LysR family regulator